MPSKLSPNLVVPFIFESGVHFETYFPHIPVKKTTVSTSLSAGSWQAKQKKALCQCPHSREDFDHCACTHTCSWTNPMPVCWVLWLPSKDHVSTEQIFRAQPWERRKLVLASIIKADINCICSLNWSLPNSENNCPYNLRNNFCVGYHCGLWSLSLCQFSYNIQRKKEMGTESRPDAWACWLLPLDYCDFEGKWEVKALSCHYVSSLFTWSICIPKRCVINHRNVKDIICLSMQVPHMVITLAPWKARPDIFPQP